MQLLIIDTAQIQGYIFGSNRLRENIGASYLVAQATGEWALTHMPPNSNVSNGHMDGDEKRRIEDNELTAEVIYAGGGNVVALFTDEPTAQEFTQNYSRDLIEKTPNLQVVVHHQPFDWVDSLYEAVQAGFKALAQKKQRRTYSTPLLGLGVTEMCRSTAFPAVAQSLYETDSYPVSREVWQKEQAYGPAKDRLQEYLPVPPGYEYPRDFDDLGRSEGEQSYIAVVHADGDGMGRRFREVGRGKSNREYIEDIRRFSKTVNKIAQNALKDTIKALENLLKRCGGDKIQHTSPFGSLWAEVILQEVEGKDKVYYLPFRPIVFGGDDVTFVCDGRLGLSLALEYMGRFAAHSANRFEGQGSVTASAGVAIVKSHYPFAQAYTITEELAKSAKHYRREKALDTGVIDWHFARSGILGSLEQVRRREYITPDGSLSLRPVTLGLNAAQSHRAWPVIAQGVTAFQDLNPEGKQRKPDWSGRSKVKALRQALRDGPAAVQQFRAKYLDNKTLPNVATDMSNWPEAGWQGEYCGYFDAIEMIDWFIPLPQQEGRFK